MSGGMEHDAILHPAHYVEDREHEPVDVILDWNLPYCLGNVVKYIARAGRKDDRLQDLKKAAWYLQKEIEREEATE